MNIVRMNGARNENQDPYPSGRRGRVRHKDRMMIELTARDVIPAAGIHKGN
jgi:hypothetical protein